MQYTPTSLCKLATCNPKLIKGRHKVCPYIIQQNRRKIKNPGSVLLSHRKTAVPSAQEGLTTVFGMGTGVTPPPLPPGKL